MRSARTSSKASSNRGEDWARRDVIRGLAAAALAWASVLTASRPSGAAGPEPSGPRDRESRRRWALARMDEMAQERLRCHERFRESADVRRCQAEFERRHRAYNEIYIEATRD